MFCHRWRLRCPECSLCWDTVLPDDTDPDFHGERCPSCGNTENNTQEFVARV